MPRTSTKKAAPAKDVPATDVQRSWKIVYLGDPYGDNPDDTLIRSTYDHSEWTLGEWRSVEITDDKPLAPCDHGFHSSPTVHDAHQFVSGTGVALVETRGQSVTESRSSVKSVHAEMRIIAVWPWRTFSTSDFGRVAIRDLVTESATVDGKTSAQMENEHDNEYRRLVKEFNEATDAINNAYDEVTESIRNKFGSATNDAYNAQQAAYDSARKTYDAAIKAAQNALYAARNAADATLSDTLQRLSAEEHDAMRPISVVRDAAVQPHQVKFDAGYKANDEELARKRAALEVARQNAMQPAADKYTTDLLAALGKPSVAVEGFTA